MTTGAWANRRYALFLDRTGGRIHISAGVPTGHVMQVSKWGNSLAIRRPATVVEALGLKEDDEVEIHVAGDRANSGDRVG